MMTWDEKKERMKERQPPEAIQCVASGWFKTYIYIH